MRAWTFAKSRSISVRCGIVRPGIGSHSPSFQSRTGAPIWASSSGVSCMSGVATTSRWTPRCRAASREKDSAIRMKMSQSLRASHGGAIAGVNACTNGCMSVLEMSYFSYQVAVGSTTSECRQDAVHPEVDRHEQVELGLGGLVAPDNFLRALIW